MSKSANPVVVGVFTLGAAALALGAVLVFGSGKFFQERIRYVIFFDQSVMGLTVGAPVIFQGVVVGSVVDIHALLTRVDPPLIQTPVYIELIQGRVKQPDPPPADLRGEKGVQQLVQNGLRAALGLQSIVTGQLYVSLEIHPDTPVRLTGADPDTVELPSTPSDLEMLKETVLMAAKQFHELPLKDVSAHLVSLLGGLDAMTSPPEARDSLVRMEQAMTGARDLLAALDGKVDGLYDEFTSTTRQVRATLETANRTLGTFDRTLETANRTLGTFDRTLETANRTLERADGTLANADRTLQDVDQVMVPGSPMQYELQATLEEVRRVARQLGTLLDELSRNPDAIIFGRGEQGDKQ
jgi:paraquat-inducible protein B